ncbi:hypothetical protein CH275_28330 [Rhodococcus sp. 06-235-1A]|nr:hypothetical protein CH275_28330 [Rhodococcus sp. 06-235-1A]OZD64763.1 hypothetical protein CH271_21195 [Rhodococcus sp. 05-340-2]
MKETGLEAAGRTSALRMAVVTAHSGGGGAFSIEDDIRMVKSSLLYADSVTLFSYSAAMLEDFCAADLAGYERRMEYLAAHTDDVLRGLGLDPSVLQDSTLTGRQRKEIRRRARRINASMMEAVEHLLSIQELTPDLHDIGSVLESGHMKDLQQVMDLGLLTLAPDGFALDPTQDKASVYTEALGRLLKDRRLQPVLDERMSRRVLDAQSSGEPLTDDYTQARARRAAVGAGLIAQLPTFPEASMKDVIDARDQLREPLLSYRAEMKIAAETIKSDAFDYSNLEADIQDLFRDQVEPKLRDFQRELAKTKVVLDAANAMKTTVAAVVSGVGVEASLLLSDAQITLPDLATMGLGSAAAGGVITSGLGIAKARFDEITKRNQEPYFYLYKLSKQL